MQNRAQVLESLRSKTGKSKYKRVSLSPLPYMGGKTIAVGEILEHIPADVTTVVSPFFGGGSVEVALAKLMSIRVIGYDVFNWLANYWKHQIENPQEVARLLELRPHDKMAYDSATADAEFLYKRCYEPNGVHDASLYYYLHTLSYGPMFLGWYSSHFAKPGRYESFVKRVRDFDVKSITVSQRDFTKSIPRHNSDFLFLDPPYFINGIHKPLYPNNYDPVHHVGFDYERLASLLKEHKGGFILCYNDCSEVRDLYKDFEIVPLTWRYTMNHTANKQGKEILVIGKKNMGEK